MKAIYVLFISLLSVVVYGQNYTVSTILNDPSADVDDAMALDSEGNLYGSNFVGNTVYKITPDGDVSPFVTGLSNPNGLAFDSHDNLFVVEYGGGAIQKFDHDGNHLETFALGGYPSGLIKAYKSDNMVFTTADFNDIGNNGIFELEADGTVKTLYQGDPLVLPVGLTYGPAGELYIGDYLSRVIYRLPKKGGIEYVATVPAPDDYVPYLAFVTYAQGFLYGTIYGENKIYKIDPRNTDDVEIFSGNTFGSADGDISEASYIFPAGILANESGNVMYVSEYSGVGNIRKITRGNDNSRMMAGAETGLERSVQFNVYPNPAKDVLNIHLKGSAKGWYTVDVYDMTAKKVYESQIFSEGQVYADAVSLVGWSAGVYQVIVSDGEQTLSRKIVVE